MICSKKAGEGDGEEGGSKAVIKNPPPLKNKCRQTCLLTSEASWEHWGMAKSGNASFGESWGCPKSGLGCREWQEKLAPKMYLPQRSSLCRMQGCSKDPSGEGCFHPQISLCFQTPSHQGKPPCQEELSWRQGKQEGEAGGV